jgi:nicotinate-nucleotide adenylyltransferase
MRVGIFGGSFDPIHQGHLILAEQCRQQAELDQVLFIPNAQSPHKQNGACASDRQRVEMVDLAIGGNPAFLRSSIEIERGGVSYTVDTLKQLAEENPENELFFLMGADSLNSFDTWKDPAGILQLATPLVVPRPGQGEVDLKKLAPLTDEKKLATIEQLTIDSPLIEISSSNIRQQIQSGKSIRYQTSRAVEKYIETQKIYLNKK